MNRRSDKRNMRTLPANRMEYLLENYPADIDINKTIIGSPQWWSREQVLKAMQAAFEAGKRDAKRRENEQ